MSNSNADFRTYDIVESNDDWENKSNFAKIIPDTAWPDYSTPQEPNMGFSLKMPSILSKAISTAKTQVVKQIKTGVSKVVGKTAQSVIEQPSVQSALTEEATDAATQNLAEQIKSAPSTIKNFANKNKKYLIAGAGLILAFVIYKKFIKR